MTDLGIGLMRTSRSARVVLALMLLLGLLSMHYMFASGSTSDTKSAAVHHAAENVVSHSELSSHEPGAKAQAVMTSAHEDSHEPSTPDSSCGGLVMMCLAMIAGVAVAMLVRSFAQDRASWVLPFHPKSIVPPLLVLLGVPPPVTRFSLLRC